MSLFVGKKTYKRMYDRKKGVFPGGFGLTASGRGALGFRGLGRGGLNGIAGITGLNGAPRIALNIGGRALGLSDRLGNDLIGTYGLLSPAGLDDTAFGVIGDSFFNPGGIIGLGGGAQQDAAAFGLASGPVLVAETIGSGVGLSASGRSALATMLSMGNLGGLGAGGVALASAAGGLAGAAGSLDFSRALGLGGGGNI